MEIQIIEVLLYICVCSDQLFHILTTQALPDVALHVRKLQTLICDKPVIPHVHIALV